MDTSKKPIPNLEPSPEIRQKILAVIKGSHGAFWGGLYDELVPEYSVESVRAALLSLMADGTLRQREDSEEHDWEYLIA